jgi:hypothetical protein
VCVGGGGAGVSVCVCVCVCVCERVSMCVSHIRVYLALHCQSLTVVLWRQILETVYLKRLRKANFLHLDSVEKGEDSASVSASSDDTLPVKKKRTMKERAQARELSGTGFNLGALYVVCCVLCATWHVVFHVALLTLPGVLPTCMLFAARHAAPTSCYCVAYDIQSRV